MEETEVRKIVHHIKYQGHLIKLKKPGILREALNFFRGEGTAQTNPPDIWRPREVLLFIQRAEIYQLQPADTGMTSDKLLTEYGTETDHQ